MRPPANRQAPKSQKVTKSRVAHDRQLFGVSTARQRRFNVASTSANRMGKVQRTETYNFNVGRWSPDRHLMVVRPRPRPDHVYWFKTTRIGTPCRRVQTANVSLIIFGSEKKTCPQNTRLWKTSCKKSGPTFYLTFFIIGTPRSHVQTECVPANRMCPSLYLDNGDPIIKT